MRKSAELLRSARCRLPRREPATPAASTAMTGRSTGDHRAPKRGEALGKRLTFMPPVYYVCAYCRPWWRDAAPARMLPLIAQRFGSPTVGRRDGGGTLAAFACIAGVRVGDTGEGCGPSCGES